VMKQLAEQCRGVRSHGTTKLGRASIQPAVCTGIHEVSSSIPSGAPRRVAVLRLSNGLTTTLRLPEGARVPERGATVLVQGGRGMGDQPASGGVTLAPSRPS
jgi:ribosomal protein S12